MRILTNAYFGSLRTKKRRPQTTTIEDVEPLYMMDAAERTGWSTQHEDPAGAVLDRMGTDRVSAAIEALPDEFRVVCALYFMNDAPYQEIAEVLDCSVGTVRSRLHRGRRLLQKDRNFLSRPRRAKAPPGRPATTFSPPAAAASLPPPPLCPPTPRATPRNLPPGAADAIARQPSGLAAHTSPSAGPRAGLLLLDFGTLRVAAQARFRHRSTRPLARLAQHAGAVRRRDRGAHVRAEPIHDHQERGWRHLDTCQLPTIVHTRVPRLKCPTHGIKQLPVPWAEVGSRFTAMFEALAIDWLRHASIEHQGGRTADADQLG